MLPEGELKSVQGLWGKLMRAQALTGANERK